MNANAQDNDQYKGNRVVDVVELKSERHFL